MPSPARPLSGLFEDLGARAGPVAFGRLGDRSAPDFLADVAALSAGIESVGSGRWLVFTDDSYAAAVGLFALAARGALAVLPPNRQPETLRQLSSGCVAALLDRPEDAGTLAVGVPALAPLDPDGGGRPPARQGPASLDRDAPFVEFRTSGTTGEGQPVVKALRHLEDEVAALDERLGAALGEDDRIFATASHQHIYGLLFRMLWPLASGRPFQSETFLHARELLPRIAASETAALVTTPVHLKRLAATDGLRELRGTCRAVFSSGGPLDGETAKAVADQLGAAPVEVFGSTETGGVATRRRDIQGEAWEPMPGVEIHRAQADGRLEVTSPFVSVGDELADGRTRLLMGDRIAFAPGGGFLLQGRADRVVKVGEKRLALPEMERALEQHPAVAEVALVVLAQAGEGRVHAAVAPTAAGREILERESRRGLRNVLSRHLSGSFDPVLLPRTWRFVDALPRDPQDKVPLAALRALFEGPADGGSSALAPGRPTQPRTTSESRDASSLIRELEIPEDLAQLEGHFDGFPVVAGVVQLGWALEATREWLGGSVRITGLDALKFPEPLLPGCRVTLELARADDPGTVRFRLHAGNRVFASGRALIETRDARGSRS